MITLSKEYSHSISEDYWYSYWEKKGLFKATKSKKEPYVIFLPPPNITGSLHMGHVLNSTIQDILVRRARMLGKSVCWIPGLDHASIATEAIVISNLQKKGITKESLTRKEFLDYVWEWKEIYGTKILTQLRSLGICCDWERLCFTMDKKPSEAVTNAFVSLHEKGLIYRGDRMINWDTERETALSDDEVIHKEVDGFLYYISYKLTEEEGEIVIATTRPETLLGDVAICIHPDDKRYIHYIGKKVFVPLVKRIIPIIADSYVDPNLGSGCLKITPAHDYNDYEIAKRHKLPLINIFTSKGKVNKTAGLYAGEDRFEARKNIVADLKKLGYLKKSIPYKHEVGFSERTDTVVEPKLSKQWFVKMKKLVPKAYQSVENGTIRFYPDKFKNNYFNWLDKIRDWCISRQLWWGHQIPAYYLPDGNYVVAKTSQEALKKAKSLSGNDSLDISQLKQDQDVLDTWFSSWLWPMTIFDGMVDPNNQDYKYYYPASDLVTGPDIIFFWVARMIMAGYNFTKKAPFKNVYFTGIVRDEKGRKMSKSLGNSPDTLQLIADHGADSVRAGLLFCAQAGNDINYDISLVKQGKKFVHKLWNALRLIEYWNPSNHKATGEEEIAILWFRKRYQKLLQDVNKCFEKFKISEAFMAIYRTIWQEFCSHYLEMIKSASIKTKNPSLEAYKETKHILSRLLKLLHPFMPFITEELHAHLNIGKPDSCLMNSSWPKNKSYDQKIEDEVNNAIKLITKVDQLKSSNKIIEEVSITLIIECEIIPSWINKLAFYIKKRTGISSIKKTNSLKEEKKTPIIFVLDTLSIGITGLEDKSNKSQKELLKEHSYKKEHLKQLERKLSNIDFLKRAPKKIIELEKKKITDIQNRIKTIESLLPKNI